MPGYGAPGASWSLNLVGWSSRGAHSLETALLGLLNPNPTGARPPRSGLSAPPEDGLGCRGWPGRSPAGQASLPREQEAEPRPADLLLEVRGLGRPSRPHFLQPRPTPCGPRVYGNSGLDGFSEIVRCLCPRLTPAGARGTQAGRPGTQGNWR